MELNIKLTGKMGRRTKYQQFDVAQLVLNVENREVTIVQSKELVDQQVDEAKENEEEGKTEEAEE